MKRLAIVAAWLSLSVFPLSCGAAAVDTKTPDARPDARLDQNISITVSYHSLEQLCAKLGEMSGVAISVDPAVRDQKVVMRVRQQPLREVMRQIALLFDFDWAQQGGDKPTYLVTQSEERARRGPAMRERYLAERQARSSELFQHALRAAVATPRERRELAKTDPEAVALAVLKPVVCQALATLDEAAREAFLRRDVTWVPLKALPKETRDYLKQQLLTQYEDRGEPQRQQHWLWDEAMLRLRLVDIGYYPWSVRSWLELAPAKAPQGEKVSASSDDLRFELWVGWAQLSQWLAALEREGEGAVIGGPSLAALQSLTHDYGIDIAAKAKDEAGAVVPEWARPKPEPQVPAASGKLIALDLTRENMFSALLDAPLLIQIADKLDLNLVADCHWTNGPHRRNLPPSQSVYPFDTPGGQPEQRVSVDASPEYTIARICATRALGWVRDGGFIRVRDLLWFADDACEVPASVLDEWMRRTDEEKHVTSEDYLYLVNNLTEIQAMNLASTAYRGQYYRKTARPEDQYRIESRMLHYAQYVSWLCAYSAIKLYGLLSPELREKAESTGIAVTSELPEELRPFVQRIAELENHLDNPGFRGSSKEIAALLTKSKFWAGYRVIFPAKPQADVTFTPSPTLCIELRTSGDPDWSGKTKTEGLLFNCALPMRADSESEPVPGGKTSGASNQVLLPVRFAGASASAGLEQLAGWLGPAAKRIAARTGVTWMTASATPNADRAGESATAPLAKYIRIRVSPTASVYVQFNEKDMRFASSAAGLATAKPVAASSVTSKFVIFPAVGLPAGADGGAGAVTLKAAFMLLRTRSSKAGTTVCAGFNLSRKDNYGAVWTYASTVQSPPGATLDEAPVIQAADPVKLTLTVVTTASQGIVGAGLRVMAGGPGQFEIRRDGQEVDAEFRLLDAKGNVVRSDRGPLAEFGFT